MQNNYIFTETDSSATISALVSAYETITGRTLLPADPDRIFISWVAAVINEERIRQNHIGNQNIPSRSSGADLDALGEWIYNLTRPGATAARCTVRFHISEPQTTSILIPKGTRVSNGGALIFRTVIDKYIAIGETFADVEAKCENYGAEANGLLPGQINTLIDVDYVLYYVSCENLDTTYGGNDEATDKEYFDLMRSSMNGYSVAGPGGAYEYIAKAVSTDISDVKALNDGPGRVAIYALMNDGSIASDEIKSAIIEACREDRKRPLTDYVSAKDPDEVTYNIELTYFIPSAADSPASVIESEAQKAVESYIAWQSGKLGRDINPTELIYRLKQIGIKRIELKSPEFTKLTDGSDGHAPQVAKLGAATIVNGGYEDE